MTSRKKVKQNTEKKTFSFLANDSNVFFSVSSSTVPFTLSKKDKFAVYIFFSHTVEKKVKNIHKNA